MGERACKWVLFGAGLAAGAAWMVVGLGALRVSKEWKAGAVRASFDWRLGWQHTERFLELGYVIENTTRSDYRLPADIGIVLVHNGMLTETAAFRLAGPVAVPAGRKARCTIRGPKSEKIDRRLEGFLVLDPASHYAIVFPAPFGPRLERRQPGRL